MCQSPLEIQHFKDNYPVLRLWSMLGFLAGLFMIVDAFFIITKNTAGYTPSIPDLSRVGIGLMFIFMGGFLYILISRRYYLKGEVLKTKFIFFPAKEINLNQVTGWKIERTQYQNGIRLYINGTKKNLIIMFTKGTKTLIEILQRNYLNKIKQRNMEHIKTDGARFKTKYGNSIFVNVKGIAFINRSGTQYFYEWKNITHHKLHQNPLYKISRLTLILHTNNGKKYKIKAHNCQTFLGAFNYICEKIADR